MNTNRAYPLVWIGLAKVEVDESSEVLQGATGGYVNVLGLATGKNDFKIKVQEALSSIGVKLKRLEQVDSLDDRVKSYEVDESLLTLAEQLMDGGERIRFSTFHVY